ncbi:MAG TPA: hypothetical protein DCE42_16730 [Myxococcales bacterium]|nr:hypothetical protein [Deltaproteobacteria bacterium]MBU53964.1 hypothetical protein [Deltaproteobacteria bacterium]HAA56413.1 hypothetical protein [Myxococcales bacterium]
MKDLQHLAQQPRWTTEQTWALEGKCRGSLMRHWAENCQRRWGTNAIDMIRSQLGPDHLELPDDPDPSGWYAVGYQLQLAESIIDTFLDGDPFAMETMLEEDGRRAAGRIALMVLRRLGPQTLLGRLSGLHSQGYSVGQVGTVITKKSAVLTYSGAALFEHPTWQLLQCFAQRILLRLTHKKLQSLHVETPSKETFVLSLQWK